MNYLLDTHLLLWWMTDSDELPSKARAILSSREHEIAYSAVNTWEIGIKHAIGRLDVPDNFLGLLAKTHFSPVHVTVEHSWAAAQLPFIHRDPFDRLLVAQSQCESMKLLTVDRTLVAYGQHIKPV